MIIVLIGKSGSGKDYTASKLKDFFSGSRIIRRPTTRPKRIGMEESYDFLEDAEFHSMVESKEIIAEISFKNWNYGFFSSIIDQAKSDLIFFLTCDVESAYKLKNVVDSSGGSMIIVHIHAPRIVRSKRATEREEFPDYKEVARRLTTEIADYNKFSDFTNEDFIIHYNNHGIFEGFRFKKLIRSIKEKI